MTLKLSCMLVVNCFRDSAILRIITLISTRKLIDTRSVYIYNHVLHKYWLQRDNVVPSCCNVISLLERAEDSHSVFGKLNPRP